MAEAGEVIDSPGPQCQHQDWQDKALPWASNGESSPTLGTLMGEVALPGDLTGGLQRLGQARGAGWTGLVGSLARGLPQPSGMLPASLPSRRQTALSANSPLGWTELAASQGEKAKRPRW